MASVIRREAVVGPGGRLEISVPELTPAQRVTVTIEVAETPQAAPAVKRHVIEIVTGLHGHRVFGTVEEVDEYIRQERDSGERELGDPRNGR